MTLGSHFWHLKSERLKRVVRSHIRITITECNSNFLQLNNLLPWSCIVHSQPGRCKFTIHSSPSCCGGDRTAVYTTPGFKCWHLGLRFSFTRFYSYYISMHTDCSVMAELYLSFKAQSAWTWEPVRWKWGSPVWWVTLQWKELSRIWPKRWRYQTRFKSTLPKTLSVWRIFRQSWWQRRRNCKGSYMVSPWMY